MASQACSRQKPSVKRPHLVVTVGGSPYAQRSHAQSQLFTSWRSDPMRERWEQSPMHRGSPTWAATALARSVLGESRSASRAA